jgi:hypothetical protein
LRASAVVNERICLRSGMDSSEFDMVDWKRDNRIRCDVYLRLKYDVGKS